jgi:BioD-like phosphotransacetylase family protein
MARKLFIAATSQDCGKTTTSLSLLHLARKKYRRIGFIKPVGPKPVLFEGRWMDKDAALVAKVYGLDADLEWMSPVVLQPGDTRRILDGEVSAEGYQEKLLTACAELDKRCDFLVIEGAGHSGVGSVLNLSNARVAHMLNAPVLMVTGGGVGHVIDDVNMNLALYEKERAEVRFVMPNKLIADKRERTLHYLSLAARQQGFVVHGGFNFSPILAGPTFQHLAKLLGLPMRASKQQGLRIIHHIQLGAASAERVVSMLDYSTLLVVTSSRDELLVMMATLYHIPEYHQRLAGLLIAGLSPVSKITQTILDDSDLPFMRAERTTAEVFNAVTRDVSKITAEDTEKITLIQSLAEQYIDFDRIDAGLD